jgi:hypothetical protein
VTSAASLVRQQQVILLNMHGTVQQQQSQMREEINPCLEATGGARTR